VYNLLHIVHEN